jgi:hypothetical protein
MIAKWKTHFENQHNGLLEIQEGSHQVVAQVSEGSSIDDLRLVFQDNF